MTTNIDKKLDRVLEIGAEIERLQQELRALFGGAPAAPARVDYLETFIASQPPASAAPVATEPQTMEPFVQRRRGDLTNWTMRFVIHSDKPVDAHEIAKAAGVKSTAVNSALATLAKQGMVFRLKSGIYFRSAKYEGFGG